MDNPYFNKAQEKAKKALKDESRISSILRSVGNKLKSGNLEVSKLGEKVKLLARMV